MYASMIECPQRQREFSVQVRHIMSIYVLICSLIHSQELTHPMSKHHCTPISPLKHYSASFK